ncbi:PREDICTED: calsyntenin-1-like [Priapulus caudatus]|uniref:Calsyntenin-1-like n=1 Tax=Priapulus caudatus TaxID=37621 RepID=A0ABM1EE08_PRICU|nr:PREDICTED: calsyntenin-1-like [Priapulus caudatus]
MVLVSMVMLVLTYVDVGVGVVCSATVRVTVEDVNEYEPYFLETSYTIVVDEGRLYDRIVQVQARTMSWLTPDCIGDICKTSWKILLCRYVKNTEPLDWGKSKNYILSVVAYDCGLKASKAVLVNIGVNRICSPQWQGIKEQVDYIPDFTPQPIFAAASLDLCGARCDAGTPSANIKLSTEHIGKGCDRDTYSSKSQRKLCGASEDVFEFLPSQGATWTDALHKDEGQESDQVFKFDGESGAVLPPEVMQDGLTETFSLALWMKHEENVTLDKHAKEHIVCNADDHKMNRHHFSLFVRNCRLILLLRREYSEANLSTFAPAEWRWKLPEVCDGEWHHYVLNAQLPKLTLFIDGALRKDTKHNPEIIDDWPLHPVRGVQRKLTVGACWRGVDKVYNYEDVLRQVNYYNNRPAFYLSRTFKLKCSELNGRFNSNEFRMELSVIHSHPKPPERAYHAAQQHMHVNIPRFHENSLHELRGKDSLHHSSSTVAVRGDRHRPHSRLASSSFMGQVVGGIGGSPSLSHPDARYVTITVNHADR